jgi:hypothetical protein
MIASLSKFDRILLLKLKTTKNPIVKTRILFKNFNQTANNKNAIKKFVNLLFYDVLLLSAFNEEKNKLFNLVKNQIFGWFRNP